MENWRLKEYKGGKLEGLDGFKIKPIISKKPIGDYSIDELVKLYLNHKNKREESPFGCYFYGFFSRILDLLGNVSYDFYDAGENAGGLIRITNKEPNILALISKYESWLNRYSEHFGRTKEDSKPLAQIAGDLYLVKAMEYLIRQYMLKFNAKNLIDYTLSKTAGEVPGYLNQAKRMFQSVDDYEGVKKVDGILESKITPILQQIRKKYKFHPINKDLPYLISFRMIKK